MRKIALVLSSVVMVPCFAFSQKTIGGGPPDNAGLELSRMQFQAKQVIPPSPEAAELGKYGNIPVSLFTGTPNVSIPLVQLKGAVLSLPVSLTYNSSGLKPEEIAPWTGLGWALNAGGVITRSVLGDPDMDDNYFISPSPIGSLPTNEYDKQVYFESIWKKEKETQPDIYFYNFMGHSGKFLVYPDGQIINKEKSYLSIVPWLGNTGEKIFIIIDEQGMQFEFSVLEKTSIQPVDDQPGAPPLTPRTFTSAWYLSKVTAPYGNEVLDFEYYTPAGAQSTRTGSLQNQSITYSLTDDGSSFWSSQTPSNTLRTFHPPIVSIQKKFLKKATLKKDSVSIGYIDFESGVDERIDLGDADFSGERLLKGVKLYSSKGSTNTLVTKFALGYEYFGAGQTETPINYRRLKLKTVQEVSPDPLITPSKPPYTFYYNGESYLMPARFTSGLDHWGFYNGQPNMYGSYATLLPTVSVASPYLNGPMGLGANREANTASANLTVLEKITYPTGGYTTFEYEGHSVSAPFADQPIGGLRIKKLVDYSFANKAAVVKMYEYKKEDGTTSATAMPLPLYYEASQYENASSCIHGYLMRYDVTISANSVFSLGTVQGSHIGYESVTEYQTDLATNQPLGKTVYQYEIQGFNEINEHLGNGDLKKQQVYDNGGKLLEETTNTYVYENTGPAILNRRLLALPAQSTRSKLYGNGSGGYIFYDPLNCVSPPSGYTAIMNVPTQYTSVENTVQQQRSKLTVQTKKIFDQAADNYLVTTKNFTYGNTDHTYPTLIEEASSKGEKFFTAIKYVADYSIGCSPQSGSMAARISEMKAYNMYGVPVEKLQYREDAGGGNRRYVSGSFTQSKLGLPEKIYFLQAKPMPTSVTLSEASCSPGSQSFNSNYRLAASMTYDADMNLVEESKTNDVVTTYFWGYNKVYPVAKVVGKNLYLSLASGISQAVLDNPSDDNTLRTELNKLRTLSPALVNTYTFKPMVGATSETDVRGRTKTYEYDLLNRLANIRDEGEIVQSFRYNYGLGTAPATSAQTLFYNAETSSPYTKSQCLVPGTYGDVVTYTVPYGKYAATSQTVANQLAVTDKLTKGQAYADAVGLCRYWSAAKHVKVFKNDCTYEQGGIGGFVWYDVPFGKYKSLVSQADADAQAQTDVETLGQEYANGQTVCSCAGEGQRFINGVCETGQLHHGSATYLGNGTWECAVYYTFSDAYVTGYYYYYSSGPCPVDD